MAARILTIEAYAPLKADGTPADKYDPAPYKFGPAVAKYRRLPRTPENIKAHGDAICAAVLSAQRSALNKVLVPISPSCASGTWHTDGKTLLKALAASQKHMHASATAASWRARTDAQVGAAYLAAMAGKDAPLTCLIHTH